jgi:uncharacterized protein DUF4410
VLRLGCSLLITICLMGCSTQQVAVPAKTNLKLVSENIGVNVTGLVADKELLDRLTREIKAQLILAGFDIEKQTNKKLLLTVNVIEFNPGSAALRLTVGFGAGRGSLIYSAEYADAEKKSWQRWMDRSGLPVARSISTTIMEPSQR